MKEYVVGFAFNNNTPKEVLLIRKAYPLWQAGHLNGVGGKIEPGETPVAAMVREFAEEAKIVSQPEEWDHFATLYCEGKQAPGERSRVYCFVAESIMIWHSPLLMRPRDHPMPKEPLVPVYADLVGSEATSKQVRIVPNLRFLIPLALDKGFRRPIVFYETSYTGPRESEQAELSAVPISEKPA